MAAASLSTIAFAYPGGEGAACVSRRPLDLGHLAKQTFGDRGLEQEVLGLFLQQMLAAKARIAEANKQERAAIAHALRGSAGGVGAFVVQERAAAVERDPAAKAKVTALVSAIDDVRDFIASISR